MAKVVITLYYCQVQVPNLNKIDKFPENICQDGRNI